MKYKNIKTGFVFETSSVVSDNDWIEIKEEQPKEEKKAKPQPKKKEKK